MFTCWAAHRGRDGRAIKGHTMQNQHLPRPQDEHRSGPNLRRWFSRQPTAVQLLWFTLFFWIAVGLYTLWRRDIDGVLNYAVILWIASAVEFVTVDQQRLSVRLALFSIGFWTGAGIYALLRGKLSVEYALLIWLASLFGNWYARRKK